MTPVSARGSGTRKPREGLTPRTPVFCHVCNEETVPDGDLEQHLADEHRSRELVTELVAEREADELGDAV